jgi:hypothetical protein
VQSFQNIIKKVTESSRSFLLGGLKRKICCLQETDQKEITIINLYVPNVSPNFTKHTLKDLKAHGNSNTVAAGDTLVPLYHQEIGHPNKKSKKS